MGVAVRDCERVKEFQELHGCGRHQWDPSTRDGKKLTPVQTVRGDEASWQLGRGTILGGRNLRL
jgi:hypothetical protein